MFASAALGKLFNDLEWRVVLVLGAVGLLLLGTHRLLVWMDGRFFVPRRKARAREAIRRQLDDLPVSAATRGAKALAHVPTGHESRQGAQGRTAA